MGTKSTIGGTAIVGDKKISPAQIPIFDGIHVQGRFPKILPLTFWKEKHVVAKPISFKKNPPMISNRRNRHVEIGLKPEIVPHGRKSPSYRTTGLRRRGLSSFAFDGGRLV
jgi:hypothetical protein